MKDSYEIKKLYESAGRGYGGGGRICLKLRMIIWTGLARFGPPIFGLPAEMGLLYIFT